MLQYWNINQFVQSSINQLGFDLDVTNPAMIVIERETLLFRPWGFSPQFLLLLPGFSFNNGPFNLKVKLLPPINATLPKY